MRSSVSYIFGSEAKVKIMRLFTFNPDQFFSHQDICERAKERSEVVRKELAGLVKAGFIKKRGRLYGIKPNYLYLAAIENFLVDAAAMTDKEIASKLSRVGAMKLVILSGLFLHDREARVDMLVVGDNLKESKLVSAIEYIEAQIGREIRYAAFETTDFQYRLGLYDKLIRDILESPHQKIINKLGL